ncbi:hypothetical protein BJ944DRAFT_152256, partial [Cunninghamella echinulata]
MDQYGFETRLWHLEHILTGDQNIQISRLAIPLFQRNQQLLKELNNIQKDNKLLKDFAAKYDPYAKLLNPVNSTYEIERELLQPETKLELIFAAYDDLEKFAAEVKQIKLLEHVINGDDFTAVEDLGPQLTPLEVYHEEQVKKLNDITTRVSKAMDTYNGIINTLSEIFIAWDDVLSTLENHVTALE